MFIVGKCIRYYSRRLFRLSSIILIGLFIITSFIYIKYKPLYKVTLNGEVIGYVEDKDKMQEKIDEFANNFEGNITSIKVEAMPVYELELVSGVKESETKENELLAKIEENAEIKCLTYAVKLDGKEKAFVNSREEAEKLIEELKNGVNEGVELNFTIEEQEKNKKEIDEKETTVEIAKVELNKDVEVKVRAYEEEQERIRQEEEAARQAEISARAAESRAASVYGEAGASAIPTGAAFMWPADGGIITSPFGYRASGYHKGLDIACPIGTPIYASAEGTVISSGWNGTGYGYLVIVDHGNGFQTYYAHCSSLYVNVGDYVVQGQNIAAVGSTGNSTGPHVHFQVMYDGVAQNPQNYI